jgi:hypothetical protein
MQIPDKEKQMFLDMQEHSEKYSDEQIETMMDVLDQLPDMETTWQKFSAKQGVETTCMHDDRQAVLHPLRRWRRVAVSIVGVIMVSVIAFAAIRIVRHSAEAGGYLKSSTQETQIANLHRQPMEVMPDDSIRVFENVELQQILSEIADHYHVGVEYRNEQTRHIRLYTRWNSSAPLKQIIERLNAFEKVCIRLNNNQLIVE